MRRLVLLLLLCGCGSKVTTSSDKPPSTNAAFNPAYHLNHAQPKLRTVKLWLGAREITAELAVSDVEIATGLMFRLKMEWNEGMLFIFTYPAQRSFYMKNTYIPLSCAYIDPAGRIVEIHNLNAQDQTPVPSRSNQIQYVLEMNQGWFEQNGVGVGAFVRTEFASLEETFFKRRAENP